jgi:hypothetical protein
MFKPVSLLEKRVDSYHRKRRILGEMRTSTHFRQGHWKAPSSGNTM